MEKNNEDHINENSMCTTKQELEKIQQKLMLNPMDTSL